jgi:hypothetical protein
MPVVSDPFRISRQAQISKALHISNDIIMPYLLLFQRVGNFGLSPLLSAKQGFCAKRKLKVPKTCRPWAT